MKRFAWIGFFLMPLLALSQDKLGINSKNYFHMDGLDVMLFSDFYPDGHQSGVTIIQHGNRVAANGDIRLEPSPGQWSPIPKIGLSETDTINQSITRTLWFPDSSRNDKSFNPIHYPDLILYYKVRIIALEKSSFKIEVDLDKPLPSEWVGKAGFNLELFPGDLFGKSYLMDGQSGIFSTQPNGPMDSNPGEKLTKPLAIGSVLTLVPEEDLQRINISSENQKLELWDGRSNHNNGWFIVRSTIAAGATKNAVSWIVTPNVIPDWRYKPVIQVSQIGYHPDQRKIAIIETDGKDDLTGEFKLYRLKENGRTQVKSGNLKKWGEFLRYNYGTLDFSDVTMPGMYQLSYGEYLSHPFKIETDVYERDVWQPTLEYFLPVQMCHMRVNEKYRVWHNYCHLDDAIMAPVNTIHFDGYDQGNSTYCNFKPFDTVPGLNRGGWHDAGDYDLRVESQIGTVYMLALMIEEFGLNYDATLIDQEKRLVEIHVPDGKSDAIQQIEHGLASVLGAYHSMGRLYRGIIAPTLRQYVMLGDASSMTDNLPFGTKPDTNFYRNTHTAVADDRLVFTEDNPDRELYVAGGLAAASRVLKNENPELADESLKVALALWSKNSDAECKVYSKTFALTELILTTDDLDLKKILISRQKEIAVDIDKCGWVIGRIIGKIDDEPFKNAMTVAVKTHQQKIIQQQASDSPYGVPYKPFIWGAGWIIQDFGVEQYFLNKGWPSIVSTEYIENSLNFVLGVHPGINTSSFASGIGSRSLTVAYGVNRADWSYIPGGVASGTALIRPDLPELKIWPYFWQQTEYVMGGGETNFMFLVMAVNSFYSK